MNLRNDLELLSKAKQLEFPYYNLESNDLLEYFLKNESRIIFKWLHYFEIYDNVFHKYRHKENLKILEIGVNRGGSLQMWKSYFKSGTKIVGIDIDEGCKQLEEENIHIRIGSQNDVDFLLGLTEEFGMFDIIIDDGSHVNEHQITTFNTLFKFLNFDGIYLCEDCHTSYWKSHGGGYLNSNSFIEYSKKLVDKLNAFHSEEKDVFAPDELTRSIKWIQFFDSIVVFSKQKVKKPFVRSTGQIDWKLAT